MLVGGRFAILRNRACRASLSHSQSLFPFASSTLPVRNTQSLSAETAATATATARMTTIATTTATTTTTTATAATVTRENSPPLGESNRTIEGERNNVKAASSNSSNSYNAASSRTADTDQEYKDYVAGTQSQVGHDGLVWEEVDVHKWARRKWEHKHQGLNTLLAWPRVPKGSASSRRMRKEGFIPSLIYGGKMSPPRRIAIADNELEKHLAIRQGSFMNTLFSIRLLPSDYMVEDPITGKLTVDVRAAGFRKDVVHQAQLFLVIPRDIRFEPIRKMKPITCNFQIYDPRRGAKIRIPLRIMDKELSPGLKRGGYVNIVKREVLCHVTGMDIPSSIGVSVAGKDVDDRINWSDLRNLPSNVKLAEKKGLHSGGDMTLLTMKGKRLAAPGLATEDDDDDDDEDDDDDDEGFGDIRL